jgi:hypothetical protein
VENRDTSAGLQLVRRSPTTLHLVPTTAEAHVFPRAAVERLRPPAGRHVLAVLLGLVLGALIALGIAPDLLPAWDGTRGTAFTLTAVPMFLLVTRGHPGGFVLGAVVGAAVGIAAGGPVGLAAAMGVVYAILGWLTWLGYASRRRWWPRLEPLLDHHAVTAGTAVSVEKYSEFPRPKLDVRVTSPEVPGQVWHVRIISMPELQPRAGDAYTVWYRPDDPEAAVLTIGTDVAGQSARAAQDRAAAEPPRP